MPLSDTTGASQAPQQNKTQPTFRASAVARIAGMPVATLRIWEQRHQAVRPNTAASGHRLYSPADVERATLLRRLTAQGHAIGSLASLETEQMREMMRAPEVRQANWVEAHLQNSIKIVVVGQSLASRVQRLSHLQPFGLKAQLVGVFDSLAASAKAAGQSDEPTADVLILQAGSLQTGVHQELRSAQNAWRAPSAAVFYRFSSAAARAELINAGVEVLS
ncbi:MAG: MerR family transcriptional regulator, partial [Rhodoferax sp.]|nr:MerR family transcriptional regulator [Rhodoferax sp.]